MVAQLEIFDSLDAVERVAGKALARDARPWMFERLDWFRMVHSYTPPEGEMVALRARNGEANAWLFLARKQASALAYTNWYCLRFGPVLEGRNAACAVDELVRGLRQSGIGHLYLAPLGGDDPLPAALRRQGWLTRLEQCNVNWRVRTKGMSFDDYWAARPSKLRNTAKRRAKAAKLDIAIIDHFDAALWADYESVYEASWKPAEGSPPLMRQMAESEGAAGTLRLGVAYLEGRPVAAQLWVVEHGIATIHKLAYREDAKHLSPGTILSVEMFRRAIDVDMVDMVDFGIGDMTYKADWMDECRPLYSLTAYDPFSLRGLAGLARSAATKLVRRIRND